MSTAASTQPETTTKWPTGLTTAIISDVIAAIAIFVSLFYHWNGDDKGTGHWFVIVAVVIGLLGFVAVLTLSLLTAFNLLGQAWDPGLNRIIRLAVAAPMIACVIAIILIDVFSSAGYNGVGKGVMPGAILGGSGALLLAHASPIERGRVTSAGERIIWKLLTLILGAVSVITLVLTTGLSFTSSDVLSSVFALVSSLVLALIVAAGLLGVLFRKRPLHNLLASLGGFVFAAAFLSFNNDWAFAGASLSLFQSTHVPMFGLVLIAMSGVAAMSHEARSDLPATAPNSGLALAFWVTLTGFAVTLTNLLGLVDISIQATDMGQDLPGRMIALLICAGAMTVFAAGAAALVRIGESSTVVAVILLSLSAILGIVVAALGGDETVPRLGWTWFVPFVVLGSVILCWIKIPDLSTLGSKLSTTFATAAEDEETQTQQPQHGQAQPQAASSQTPSAAQSGGTQPDPEPVEQTGPGSGSATVASQGQAAAAPPPPPQDPEMVAAQDPQTSQIELARLAAEAPHTRAAIAAHPRAYPGLLQWLETLNDPAVNEALSQRDS